MSRVVMIIQARMGSRRLPGKSMMDLAGEPLVGRLLERVKRCSLLDDIVLAVPGTVDNLPLAKLGDYYRVAVFTGSEDDLVDRYCGAAIQTNADYIVRLPADNPTPEPEEIDRIIDHHLALARPGFSSNLSVISDNGYPDGIGAEIFDTCLLEEVRKKVLASHLREHVHLNFYDYSTGLCADETWCPVSTVRCPESFRRPDLVLDVNTLEQYQFMKQLYEYLYPKNAFFHVRDTIRWYDEVYKGSCPVTNE